jgi:23S rRNA (cytosine1962-C5)-methyltransferase
MTNPKQKSHSTPHRPSQGGIDFRNRVKRDKQKTEAPAPKIAATPPRAGNPMGRPCLILKADRDKSLLRRHPWIFSGAVECFDGTPAGGDTVAVRDASGKFLAWAAYNAASQITARVWSWNETDVIDKEFFRSRIANALAVRRTLGLARDSSGMRIIHGESDGLPGLIVDQYGDVLVMQLGSAGPEHWRETFADILQELCAPVCIYERSDSDGRELEGLPVRSGVLRGTLPAQVEVTEHGLRFAVDVATGQKTGFYLDQRDNRALTGTLAADCDVLNCFCYTGGFSLYALRGGAKSVLSIDASEGALELARRNVELNGLDGAKAEWQCADVFEALRKLRDQNRKFELIVLDPP